MNNSRRHFVTATAAGLASTAMAAGGEIPKRTLGKTGLQVSLVGLGGARTGNLPDENEAVRVIKHCYDSGINYFDTAAAGAYGLSQRRYGIALKGLRDKLIFATKTRNRSRTQSQLDLDQSLANLKTDYLDLYQIHNVINDEDIEFIFGPRGVMETVEKAKKEGKVRFVGFTGHTEPAILNKMMERYNFDTVLMPLSATDGANKQKGFERETLPLARKKNLGVIAMKTLGAGAVLEQKAATVDECLRYVFTLPVATAIMGITDIAQANQDVALAKTAKPMTAREMESLRRRMAGFTVAQLEPWKLGREEDPSGPVYRAD